MGKLGAPFVASPASRRSQRTGWMQAAAAILLIAAVAAALIANDASARTDAPSPVTPVIPLIEAGRFNDAEAAIARALARTGTTPEEADALRFERERMRRILLDFSLDQAQAMERVRRQVPDLRDQEFARWDGAGLLEKRTIDGRVRYFNRAPSNLFRLSPEAFARRTPPTPLVDGPMERANPHHREVRDAALAGKPAARSIRVTQSLVVDADAVPAGETVRAWIPFPRAIPGQQEAIRLVGSSPAVHDLAPASAPMRTVYLEAPARAGEKTRFEITYEMTVLGQYRLDAASSKPTDGGAASEDPARHLGERPPHIVFTEALRAFSRRVVGDETDKWRIAQKLYAAVDQIPWAGALEYSTIPNISDYALRAGHADCGQQTLLLMALLRLNGIPARWQSGMVFSDGAYDNLHDWGWMHVAPHGWIPMDVTTGRLDDPDPAIAGFYLGGLDAYRIAFNDDYGQGFTPDKQHARSDDVDSQRGEVEWRGGNLYFDQWDYGFTAKVLAAPAQAQNQHGR